jgi:anaerobic C4-dicarboxylate transporter
MILIYFFLYLIFFIFGLVMGVILFTGVSPALGVVVIALWGYFMGYRQMKSLLREVKKLLVTLARNTMKKPAGASPFEIKIAERILRRPDRLP